MKWIMAHFGEAAMTAAILIALAVLMVALLAKNGVIEMQFTQLLTDFFGKIMAAAN